jgi:hypothetical protein
MVADSLSLSRKLGCIHARVLDCSRANRYGTAVGPPLSSDCLICILVVESARAPDGRAAIKAGN